MKTQILTGYPSIDKPWLKYYDSEKLNAPFPKMTIYEYLREQTQGYDSNVAMTYFGCKITYAEMFRYIDKASQVLTAMGVKPGNRILYLMPNVPETAYLFYGGAKIGAVSSYVDPRPDSLNFTVSAKKVLALLKEEKIDYVISLDQCYLAMLKPVEQELAEAGIKEIIIVSAGDSINRAAKMDYLIETAKFNGLSALSQAMAKSKNISKLIDSALQTSSIRLLKYSNLVEQCCNIEVIDAVYKEDALAVIVHTSGTSSPKPKPIPLTHDNLNCYVHQTYSANMPMKQGDKALQMLPYFAAYGLVNVVHALFCHANNLIQIPEFLPQNLGKLIAKNQPQTIIGAPSWFLPLISDPALNKQGLIVFNNDNLRWRFYGANR